MSLSMAQAEEILATLKAHSQCEVRSERKVNKIYVAITSLPHTSLREHFIVVVCDYSNNSSINRQQSLFYVCIFNINFFLLLASPSSYVGIFVSLSLFLPHSTFIKLWIFCLLFSFFFTSLHRKIWQDRAQEFLLLIELENSSGLFCSYFQAQENLCKFSMILSSWKKSY